MNAFTGKLQKLSYRRETARQLPTWREGGDIGPPAYSPSAPSGYTYAYGRIRKPQRSVPSVKRTLRWIGHSRSFKVIPIGASRNPKCCRNVQLMPTLFLKLTKIRQREKRQIRRFQRPHARLKTSQQETLSNIYKWFILPETRVIDLHFCRW